jgi:hypothetical protein
VTLKSERRWHRWKRFIPLFEPVAWVLVRFPPLGIALANAGLRHALKQANADIVERREQLDRESGTKG